jgi:vacuolar iron transporter family protein
VFGANDGLVSNLSLVLGVTGGGASTTTVLLTGLAGLLSGALSMGAGEYVSVRSQRELLAASAPDISDAHTVLPALDLNANELALVYRARGVPADEARRRVGFQNAATVPDQRFQAAAPYSLGSPPKIGRRRILPWTGSGTGDVGRGGRNCSARCGRAVL